MPLQEHPGRKRVLGLLAFAGGLVVVLPVLGRALGVGLSPEVILGYLLLALAGYAVFLLGMPFFFWVIGEAGYRTFLKPYYRAWRIRRIRNRRLWEEVASRGTSDSPS